LAEDDPIVPAADLARLAASSQLTVARTRYGGHCGFALGVMGPSAADRFVLEQFERFERLGFGPVHTVELGGRPQNRSFGGATDLDFVDWAGLFELEKLRADDGQ